MKRWIDRDNRDEAEWEVTLDDGRLLHCQYRAKIIGPDHTGSYAEMGASTLNVYCEENDPNRDGEELACTELPPGMWGRLEQAGFERIIEERERARSDDGCECA